MKNILAFLLLVAVLASAVPVPAFALTKKIETAGSPYTIVDKRDYPIIFIHGAAGAELEKNGASLWPGNLGGVVNDSAAAQLALNSDGKTDCCGTIDAPRIMKYASGYDSVGAGFISVYAGFYTYMEEQGFGYEKKHDGKVFYDFVYDWREDNRTWTKDLDKKVDQVLKETGAEKVYLIGHSMGGLQARLYMKDAGRAKKVAGVIFLGTPHHGAPQVYWAYTYGYNFGNPKVGITRMWEVMKNWPAGYQLLPDYPTVQDESGKFWTLDQMYSGGTFYSEQEYSHKIDGAMQRKDYLMTSGLPNTRFAKDAVEFHKYLGDSVDKYPGVKYVHIAGTGQKTLQYLEATMVNRPGFDLPILTMKRIENTHGDGTVAAAGAKIEGVDEYLTVVGEHAALPGIPEVTGHITRLRESWNDEKARVALARKVKAYAENRLPQLEAMRSAGLSSGAKPADNETSLVSILFRALFFGAPDEQKIKQRDDLRRYVAKIFEDGNVNVKILASDGRSEEDLFAVIRGFKVIETGTGIASPQRALVTVKDYATFEALTNGNMDARDALKSGAISLSGGGLIDGLKTKVYSWWLKYGAK
ncbi:MAG: alpha/beta fold hydrolase [Patescibacteria group bacterium]